MTQSKKKTDIIVTPDDTDFEISQFDDAMPSSKRMDSKRIRRVSPVGMRVLVSIRKDSNQTDGGLYLPEGAKQALQESLVAKVIEVASAVDDSTDEEHNVSGIPLGSLVLIPKHAGTKIPWDDTLRIVETKEVLAIVNEISIT